MDPKELEKNPEFAALQEIEGVDKDDLRQQAGLDDTPPVDTPPQPGPQDAFLQDEKPK